MKVYILFLHYGHFPEVARVFVDEKLKDEYIAKRLKLPKGSHGYSVEEHTVVEKL